MHNDLPQLVSTLLTAADDPAARTAFKSNMLDLAKLAQTVPEHRLLTHMVAKSMSHTVEAAFGPLTLIFLLTEPGRRQIYLAVLARHAEIGIPKAGETRDTWRKALMVRLLLEGDEDLLTQAYGHCPAGFVRVLKRLGQIARGAHIYTGLFQLLDEAPRLGLSLQNVAPAALTDELIELLIALRHEPRAMSLAKRFETLAEYRRFMSTYCVLTGDNTLREEHIARLCSGEAPSTVLQSIYFDLSFGPPAISLPNIRYIPTGAELAQVSADFKNCLRNYVAEAIRGERQYYLWEKRGQPLVVFCICADRPFGWHLAEYKLAGNERVPESMAVELKSLLEFASIRTGGSVEEMMSQFVSHRFEADLEELFQDMAA